MQQSGQFGMHGVLRSAFRFTEDYPLATLAIDPDILEQARVLLRRDLKLGADDPLPEEEPAEHRRLPGIFRRVPDPDQAIAAVVKVGDYGFAKSFEEAGLTGGTRTGELTTVKHRHARHEPVWSWRHHG